MVGVLKQSFQIAKTKTPPEGNRNIAHSKLLGFSFFLWLLGSMIME
jgi:hypothetical protein